MISAVLDNAVVSQSVKARPVQQKRLRVLVQPVRRQQPFKSSAAAEAHGRPAHGDPLRGYVDAVRCFTERYRHRPVEAAAGNVERHAAAADATGDRAGRVERPLLPLAGCMRAVDLELASDVDGILITLALNDHVQSIAATGVISRATDGFRRAVCIGNAAAAAP